MDSLADSPLLPPARRLRPAVRVDEQREFQLGNERISAYFSQLTDTQAKLVEIALKELPSLIRSVKAERLQQAGDAIRFAFVLPAGTLESFRDEAWAFAQWQSLFLSQTPCIPRSEAELRCERSPWDAKDDLLGLPSGGRHHFPLFQFGDDGLPDAWFVAVLAALRADERRSEWDLLHWLVRPTRTLKDLSPLASLRDDPKRVLAHARNAAREGLL